MNTDSTRTAWRLWAILLLVWAVVYLPALARPALLDDADTVHAEAAREMLLRHDWVTLHVNGIRYLDKAPLLYWLTAALYRSFGVHEWTTRLPLALGTLALMVAVFGFGRRAFGLWAGFYAALVIATAPGLFVYTRFMIPDVFVALWLTLGMWAFWEMLQSDRPAVWLCWSLAASTALNVLTKSLIGLVFPGLIILAYLLLTRRLQFLARMRLLSSAVVFVLIAAPWHVLAALRNPAVPGTLEKGFLWYYFINEQFLRYLNERIPRDYDTVPLLLFWLLVLVWVFPWAAYLPVAVRGLGRFWTCERLDPERSARLLLVVWAVVIVGFFSFSTRQEYYTLPVVPALALLLGEWLAREHRLDPQSVERRWARSISTGLAIFGAAVAIAALVVWARTKPLAPHTDLADFLTEHPGKYALSLGHLNDLTLAAFGAFHKPLLELAVAFLFGFGLAAWFRRQGWLLRANAALAAAAVVFLLAIQEGYIVFNPILSSKAFAVKLQQVLQPEDALVINGDYEWGSSVPFYTGHPALILNGRRADLWFGSLFPDAPQIFLDQQQFVALWNSPRRVFLFTPDFNASQGLRGLDPRSVHLVARKGGKLVYCNRPLGQDLSPVAGGRPAG